MKENQIKDVLDIINYKIKQVEEMKQNNASCEWMQEKYGGVLEGLTMAEMIIECRGSYRVLCENISLMLTAEEMRQHNLL